MRKDLQKDRSKKYTTVYRSENALFCMQKILMGGMSCIVDGTMYETLS